MLQIDHCCQRAPLVFVCLSNAFRRRYVVHVSPIGHMRRILPLSPYSSKYLSLRCLPLNLPWFCLGPAMRWRLEHGSLTSVAHFRALMWLTLALNYSRYPQLCDFMGLTLGAIKGLTPKHHPPAKTLRLCEEIFDGLRKVEEQTGPGGTRALRNAKRAAAGEGVRHHAFKRGKICAIRCDAIESKWSE